MRQLVFGRLAPALVIASLLMIPLAPVAQATFTTPIESGSGACRTDSATHPGQMYIGIAVYDSAPLLQGEWLRVSARNAGTGELTVVEYNDRAGAYPRMMRWVSLPDGAYTVFAEYYTPWDIYGTGQDGYYTREMCPNPQRVISGDAVAPPPATTGARTMAFYAIARSTMRRGARSHVRAAATPGASCTGRIIYANGKATRFVTKTAPSSYFMNWYPRIPKTAAKGRATVRLSCTKAGYADRKTTIRVTIR